MKMTKRIVGTLCILLGVVFGVVPFMIFIKNDQSEKAFQALGGGAVPLVLGIWLWQNPRKKGSAPTQGSEHTANDLDEGKTNLESSPKSDLRTGTPWAIVVPMMIPTILLAILCIKQGREIEGMSGKIDNVMANNLGAQKNFEKALDDTKAKMDRMDKSNEKRFESMIVSISRAQNEFAGKLLTEQERFNQKLKELGMLSGDVEHVIEVDGKGMIIIRGRLNAQKLSTLLSYITGSEGRFEIYVNKSGYVHFTKAIERNVEQKIRELFAVR